MPIPQINSMQLDRYYGQFLTKVENDLRLSRQESALVKQAKPQIWADWAVSALDGDERVAYPHRDGLEGFVPDDAIPLFAKEVEIHGIPALDYKEGILAQRITAMYESRNPSMPQRLERINKVMAAFTWTVGAAIGLASPRWTKFVPQTPQTIVHGDKETGELGIRFPDSPGFRFPVEGPAKSVATFGPGLTGSIFAGTLTGYTDEILFVSGGKGAGFVTDWIGFGMQAATEGLEKFRKEGQLQQQLPPGIPAESARIPEARYFSKGIAAAGKLSTKSQIDMVVMSSVHSAGPEECTAGIIAAGNELRPGGLLVIKAPDVSLGGEAGMDLLTPTAKNLFGTAVAAGECGTLQQHIDPSLPVERSASFAIYQR